MRHRQTKEPVAPETLVRLTIAFQVMRRRGLIARQSYTCCGSCGSYNLATDYGAMPAEKRAKVAGVAFYSRQARESMLADGDGVYINYSQARFYGDGGGSRPKYQSPLDDAQVGALVVESLADAGLIADWDGDPAQAIWVGFGEVRADCAACGAPVTVPERDAADARCPACASKALQALVDAITYY